MDEKKYVNFSKKLVIVGFGSIGQAVLPLILRHMEIQPQQITVLTKRTEAKALALKQGVHFHEMTITPENYQSILNEYLAPGDFLLNLSVDVSSKALIEFCAGKNVLYLDTCIEPWAGGYTDASTPAALRSNYALRESLLALRKEKGPTALITHGANPGLVSYFVKAALLNIAKDNGMTVTVPKDQAGWADLAAKLNIKAIHVAEQDTQVGHSLKRPGEFVNTWSIDGFVAEGSQPAELGWGSHERHFPEDGEQFDFGPQCAIYLNRPGAATKVRTWAPLAGSFHGYLITHGESISIANYLTVKEDGVVKYRPTVHYAYHPCLDAILSIHELAEREWMQQEKQRLLFDEITDGIDELGVLLMGNQKGAYWFGSQLSIHEARELAPYNTATSLQVAAGVLAGMVWCILNPERGIVEPDELPHEEIMAIAEPYLGKVVGQYTDWTPIQEREKLFPEEIDRADPWQFLNVRVV